MKHEILHAILGAKNTGLPFLGVKNIEDEKFWYLFFLIFLKIELSILSKKSRSYALIVLLFLFFLSFSYQRYLH